MKCAIDNRKTTLDRRAYRSACRAARNSIQRSRADYMRDELAVVSGDMRSTCRAAQRLFHLDSKVIRDDADCKKLTRSSASSSSTIRSTGYTPISPTHRDFPTRQHEGPTLSSFQPVKTDEVHIDCWLATKPSKSSSLDILPSALLKSCSDVFAPVIARLADLSFQTDKFPTRYKRAQVLPLLKKAGLDSSVPANYRLTSNLSTVSKILERLVLALRLHL